MMDTAALRTELRPAFRSPDDAALELLVGEERIEVRVDRAGIYFRHPGAGGAEGCLPWDVAIAMSLVPADARPRAALD